MLRAPELWRSGGNRDQHGSDRGLDAATTARLRSWPVCCHRLADNLTDSLSVHIIKSRKDWRIAAPSIRRSRTSLYAWW